MAVNETIERIIFEGVDKITSASKSAEASTKALKETISGVKDIMGALGITVGAGAFVKLQLDALHATAALKDMSEATGASVENLSAIQRVAKVGGHDFDGLTQQIGRMVRGLKDNTDEGNKSIAALGQLGIKARDANGHWRDTGQILIEVAQRMGQFRTDADRVAFVQDALGKGAERYIPLLKQMAEGTDLHATTTKRQAEQAEEAEKNINRLKLSMEDARKELVNEFTPALIDHTNRMLAAKEGTKSWWEWMVNFMRIGGGDKGTPSEELDKIDVKIQKLKDDVTLMKGSGFAWFSRDDIAIAEAQIASFQKTREILLKLKARVGDEDRAPGGAMDMGVGVNEVFAGQDYQSLDPRRLKPTEILKMQQQGQDDFNEYVKKSNAEMYKVTDEQQKKNLVDHTANLMAAYDRERELAVENVEKTGAADGESHSMQLARLNEYLVGSASLEDEAYAKRIQALEEFSDDELAVYGGRLAVIEALYGDHNARLMEIDRNRHQAERSMEQGTWQLAANLISLFAGKSKAAAIAVIAISKGLAIAQTIQATAVATMRAFSDLGPVLGVPAAARIQTLGAIQIGLIAATGLVEAAQAVSGGGSDVSIGTSASQPVFAANPVTGTPQEAAPQRNLVIEIRGVGAAGRLIAEDIATQLSELKKDGGFPELFEVKTV